MHEEHPLDTLPSPSHIDPHVDGPIRELDCQVLKKEDMDEVEEVEVVEVSR